jgi:hypothetical protein
MAVPARVRSKFSLSAQDRGRALVRDRLVRVDFGTARRLVATGSTTAVGFRAEIEWDGAVLRTSCDCLAVRARGAPCEHLYAALVLGDARGHLTDLPPGGPESFEVRWIDSRSSSRPPAAPPMDDLERLLREFGEDDLANLVRASGDP